MGKLAASKKRIFLVVFLCAVLPLGLITAFIVNTFFYPFTSANPNFNDVEAVYSKMQVPEDWIKQGEGSNKGIAGRQCPIESDGCFSKVGRYIIPVGTTPDDVKSVFESLGCVSVSSDRSEQAGGVTYTDFECSVGGLRASGSLTEESEWEIVVGVKTY
jgi:hypothetical protein